MNIDKLLEPVVPQQAGDHTYTTDQLIALSQAVSLRRIADALSMPDHDTQVGLASLVQNLAWEAGRSFQHGTRTDR